MERDNISLADTYKRRARQAQTLTYHLRSFHNIELRIRFLSPDTYLLFHFIADKRRRFHIVWLSCDDLELIGSGRSWFWIRSACCIALACLTS